METLPTVGQRVTHRRFGAGIVVHSPAEGFTLVRFDGPIGEHRVHKSALQPERTPEYEIGDRLTHFRCKPHGNPIEYTERGWRYVCCQTGGEGGNRA